MKKMTKKMAGLLTSVALSVTFAQAALAASASDQIESAIGAKVIKSSPSVASGYNAILAEKDGKKRIFYETQDGQFLFYGMMYDKVGNNLTALDAANFSAEQASAPVQPKKVALAEHPSPASPQISPLAEPAGAIEINAINSAEKSYFIKEGKGDIVYVVIDPNCPYCKELYRKTRHQLGHKEIRWIPVGVLTPPVGDSQKKSASLLRSAGAVKGSDMTHLQLVKPVDPTPEELNKLDTNLNVMIAAQSNQVPLIIWKDKSGVKVVKGLPSDPEIESIFSK